MHLLYTDETNLEERKGDFFVYAGLVVDGARAKTLAHDVESVRLAAKVDRSFKLKFNPGPENLSHQEFLALKQSIIDLSVAHSCHLLAYVVLHDVATDPNTARLNGINTICAHFDWLLNRKKDAGLVLIDRFSDPNVDAHVVEKMAVGLKGMPFSSEMKLDNIVGVHYSAVGQSHFSSVLDIVIGSLRFSINAFTRNETNNLPTAKKLLGLIKPLFFRDEGKGAVAEIGFCYRPKEIRIENYKSKYQALKAFLVENGIETAQAV